MSKTANPLPFTGLITEKYRKLNAEHHKRIHSFGAGGDRVFDKVRELIIKYNAKTLLDYGCGKATLGSAFKKARLRGEQFHLDIREYDPAIHNKCATPEPADLVICRDVMEHIEPECLENVLLDLRRVTVKCLYAVIATRPSQDILSDGSNAHRIIQKAEWWQDKLQQYFTVVDFQKTEKRDCQIELI